MTPGEFREYVKTMKEFGISKLIIHGVEITLTPKQTAVHDNKNSYDESNPVAVAGFGDKKQEDPIQHRQEQLSSLLKLSDPELVDQLFPLTNESA